MSYRADKLKMGLIETLKKNLTLKVKVNHPQNNRVKVFYTYGPNFVFLAWTGDELSCSQAGGWRTHTDTHTDRRWQRQYPKVKTGLG